MNGIVDSLGQTQLIGVSVRDPAIFVTVAAGLLDSGAVCLPPASPNALPDRRGRYIARVLARPRCARDCRSRAMMNAMRWWCFIFPLLLCAQELKFATYLGGGGGEATRSVAVDPQGNIYVTGRTDSPDFPLKNAIQPQSRAYSQTFVTKFRPDGELIYSTYLGGSSNDAGMAIAVDAGGNAYVTGNAHSTDFPVTAKALQANSGGAVDAIVYKLDAAGNVAYATYLGGSDNDLGEAIAVDGSGNVYVAGRTYSRDFPVSPNALQEVALRGSPDAFVTKLDASGNLVYSTYLSGHNPTVAYGIAVDESGEAVVVGETSALDFPTTPGAAQAGPGRTSRYGVLSNDAFIAKLSADGGSLVYSSVWGGAGSDSAHSVTLDATGNAYITGLTTNGRMPIVGGRQQYLGGDIYYRSTDGGNTFEAVHNGLRASSVLRVVQSPRDPLTIFAGTAEGVCHSTNGGESWSPSGLDGLAVSQIVFDPTDPQTMYVGTGLPGSGARNGLFRSADGGATWTDMNAGFSTRLYPSLTISDFSIDALAVDPADPATLYAVTGTGGQGFGYDQPLYRITEDGNVWTQIGRGLASTPTSLAVGRDSTLLVGTGLVASRTSSVPGTVYRRSGDAWAGSNISDDIRALAVAGDTIYAAGRRLFISTDGGATWDSKSMPSSGPATQLEVAPNDASSLYILVNGYAWKTLDAGDTWSPVA